MTPKEINEINRKFYPDPWKPSFWHEHVFATMIWATVIVSAVYFFLRLYQLWYGGQGGPVCLGYPVWLGHFWLNVCY